MNTLLDRLHSLFTAAPAEPEIEPLTKPALHQMRKDVCVGLVEGLQPLLAAIGFGRFSNGTAWRRGERWVDVIQIQFIRSPQTSAHSPSLHLGRYFDFVPPRDPGNPVRWHRGQREPMPEQCHIRKSLYKPVRDKKSPPATWPIGPAGEGLEQCIAQALLLAQSHIVPWCLWLDDTEAALQLVLNGISDMEGESDDPLMCGTWNHQTYFGRHVLGGMLALERQRWSLADKLLGPVIRQGGTIARHGRLFPMDPKVLAELSAAREHALKQMQQKQ